VTSTTRPHERYVRSDTHPFNKQFLLEFKSRYVKGEVYAVLKEVPHHEDVLGSGGIAPHIHNLCTRYR